MSPAAEQLLASALALSEVERIVLAEALHASHLPPVPDVGMPEGCLTGEAWEAELQRRTDQVTAGTAKLIPWRQALAEVHARFEAQARG